MVFRSIRAVPPGRLGRPPEKIIVNWYEPNGMAGCKAGTMPKNRSPGIAMFPESSFVERIVSNSARISKRVRHLHRESCFFPRRRCYTDGSIGLRASPVLSNKASSGVMEPISEGASG